MGKKEPSENVRMYRMWRAVGNAWFLFLCVFFIGCIWQLLEIHFYGEIQHRRVDDIIELFNIFAIYCAYGKGKKDGRIDEWMEGLTNGNINGEYPDNLRDGSGDNGN